ncbi:MAG: hypothetical protein V4732_07690 [Pseudomonadota bacterium]
MRQLTPRDKSDINEFKLTTGSELVCLDRYLSEEWEWHELWDYNFDRAVLPSTKCKCRFEGVRASLRRKGYPRSIHDLEQIGFHFTPIGERSSWYEDACFQCSCGQKWKEVFVEAMQYSGNHARPIDDYE